MEQFEELTAFIGTPLSPNKKEGLATCLTFLGIEIDTIKQQISIPEIKRQQALELVLKAMDHRGKKVTVCFIQKLTGKLQFVTRGIPAGRAFLCRLYDLQKLSLPYSVRYTGQKVNPLHHVKLNEAAYKDLCV